MIKNPKRITLFAGHYGSGKTNIAVNFALSLKKMGKMVEIADLDIVNPYYRTKDSEKELKEAGIRVISSEFANSNVDFPAMPGEAYSIIDNKDSFAVCDVGGDVKLELINPATDEDVSRMYDESYINMIRRIKALFADALSTDSSIIEDNSNFIYDLGGSSMAYYNLFSLISKEFSVELEMSAENPLFTPADFAKAVLMYNA